MRDPLQKAEDGLWISLVKHFGLYGVPSTDDDSTLDVDFRKKAQTMLPELEKTWVIDEWTLPTIQELPAKIEALVASLDDPAFESYPIYALRTEVPPLVPAVSAIKNGDLTVDAAKSIDAVVLVIIKAFMATDQNSPNNPEGPGAEKLNSSMNGFTDAWEKVSEKMAEYFFGWLMQKSNENNTEE